MRDSASPKPQPRRQRICLALQGGGAHGAFTWGVLDRLLEEEWLDIEGVSATSAGAMNGAMLTTGLKSGGREEAQHQLRVFWERMRDLSPLNQPPWSFWTGMLSDRGMPNLFGVHPGYLAGEVVSRLFSPYQFNPANINPLRDALSEMVDFSKVCREDDPRLFVCATDVRSGRAKVFQGDEISTDALLASACLPTLFQAVRIDGRDYWDGGYTGNPPIWPLIYFCQTEDVVIVHINPIVRQETPTTPDGIFNRMNEIAFNSNLLGEMRAIDTVARLVEEGHLPDTRYKKMRIHAIADEETMRMLGAASKLNPAWTILQELHEAGRDAAARWLEADAAKLGDRSSVDIRERYL
ncbi:MAG: patatin-like phospholipase family protein [Neomegalonema sp.]|nr:patatin-like phospholipase family protein [Neomegalonema sp.]